MEGIVLAPHRRPRGRRLTGLACAVLTLSVAACSGSSDAAPAPQQPGPALRAPGGGGGPGGGRPPAAVETARAERGTIARTVTVSGTVEPIRSIGVNSQLAGALLAVNAEEGTVVGAGRVLAQMDDRELRAQVNGARASLEVSEAAYRRAEQLLERTVITAAEYERERAAYTAAQARLDELRTRLGFTQVRAPLAGIVTEKHVERGDVVGSQARLFTIADVSTLVVRVQVSELDVVSLATGDRVQIALDAFPGQSFEGTVRRVFPAADPASRLVPVEVAVGAAGARVARPGFLARVALPLQSAAEALLVPASAVVGEGTDQAVFVIRDGTAVRRPVATGLVSQGRIQILSGIESGDEVVTVGTNGLRDGATVRVVGTAREEGRGKREEEQHGREARNEERQSGGIARGDVFHAVAPDFGDRCAPAALASATYTATVSVPMPLSLFPLPSSLFPRGAA